MTLLGSLTKGFFAFLVVAQLEMIGILLRSPRPIPGDNYDGGEALGINLLWLMMVIPTFLFVMITSFNVGFMHSLTTRIPKFPVLPFILACLFLLLAEMQFIRWYAYP